MQILTVDVGTGTQDILLFDTTKEPENALKMIMPSPTQRVANAIRDATRSGCDVLLTGATMGGGPSAWAADDHLRAGLKVYATPQAACTFDDNLEEVAERGVVLVSEDEAFALRNVCRITMRDLDMIAIRKAFGGFDVSLEPAAIGVAVFDHGAAPAGYSDRRFRFDYLTRQLKWTPELTSLAFLARDVPAFMTRMLAVVEQAGAEYPLLLMDTPSAAVLGALEDPQVGPARRCIAMNVGNQHTLAFRLEEGVISGLFEHHTGKLTPEGMDCLIAQLAAGTIENEDVFRSKGHGALLLRNHRLDNFTLAVTGPRRSLMRGSRHGPYFAVPFGDMMVAGCWGLVRAMAAHLPQLQEEIVSTLSRGR